MNWKLVYLPEAKKDFKELSGERTPGGQTAEKQK